jgi:hypothetical protein
VFFLGNISLKSDTKYFKGIFGDKFALFLVDEITELLQNLDIVSLFLG